MFILVTYPWPVPSAHVELTGPTPPPDGAVSHCVAVDQAAEPRTPHVEEMVCWTDLERLRLQWYRLRLAIADARRRHGSPGTSVGSPATRR